MKNEKFLFLGLVMLLTAVRLWLASQWTVTPEEAFYWLCAQRMDLAFFDDPWGTAWVIKIGTSLGGDAAFGVRWIFPLCAGIATLAAWSLARKLAGPSTAWWTVVLLNATPGFQVAAIEAGPVMPALAASLVGLLLIASRRDTLKAWIFGGFAVAVALQFSLWPLVVVPAVLTFLLPVHGDKKGSVPWGGVVCFGVIVMAALSPFLIWNMRNDWAIGALGTWQTFTEITKASIIGSWDRAARTISGPAVVAMLIGVGIVAFRWRHDRKSRRVAMLALPVAMVWLMAWLVGHSETFLILLGFYLIAGAACLVTPIQFRAGLSVALAVMMSGQFYFQATARLPDLPWSSIRRSVEALLAAGEPYQTAPIFLIAQSERLTASLNYHLAQSDIADETEVFLLESQNLANQFGIWPSYDDFVDTGVAPDEFFEELKAENPYQGRSAFYLTREPEQALPQAITAAFEEFQPAATIALSEGGTLYIYFCRHYQTLPL